MNFELMRRGYHAQSAVGVFIAAAVAGKILHLNSEQMTHALAIAGSHAGGTMEYDQSGGEVKRMHNGMACSGGLRSAMTADKGLTGPPTVVGLYWMGFGVAILLALALGWMLTAAGLAELPPDVGAYALRIGGVAASTSLAWGAYRYAQGITIRRKP